jgi:hypothetical protein
MKIQIDDQVRDATPDEAAHIDQIRQGPTTEERIDAIESAKASARTKLKALGLTDAEVAALVG